MNISGAIFDLDGTLLDTTEIWEGVAAHHITAKDSRAGSA